MTTQEIESALNHQRHLLGEAMYTKGQLYETPEYRQRIDAIQAEIKRLKDAQNRNTAAEENPCESPERDESTSPAFSNGVWHDIRTR